MIREVLERLLAGESLDREQAAGVMRAFTSGEVSEAQVAGLLVALRMSGETSDVLAGFAQVMRECAVPVPVKRRPLLDTCGTGGDGSHSVNISTAAGLVAASCGAVVAKHGNRSISSRCGAADVLEAMGLPMDLEPQDVARCVDQAGFGFLFAPALHPAMKHVLPARRALGVRTVFNLLGPLTNPAGAQRQLLGAPSESAAERMAGALAQLGAERAWVVHGHGGLDELTTTGINVIFEVEGARVRRRTLDPLALGLAPAAPAALQGGDVQHNADWLRGLLAGKPDPAVDTVALNAAAALVVVDIAGSLEEGLARSREALASGSAGRTWERVLAAAGRA